MAKPQADREAGTGVQVGAESGAEGGAGSGAGAEVGAEAEPQARVGAQALYLLFPLFPQTPFPLPEN